MYGMYNHCCSSPTFGWFLAAQQPSRYDEKLHMVHTHKVVHLQIPFPFDLRI